MTGFRFSMRIFFLFPLLIHVPCEALGNPTRVTWKTRATGPVVPHTGLNIQGQSWIDGHDTVDVLEYSETGKRILFHAQRIHSQLNTWSSPAVPFMNNLGGNVIPEEYAFMIPYYFPHHFDSMIKRKGPFRIIRIQETADSRTPERMVVLEMDQIRPGANQAITFRHEVQLSENRPSTWTRYELDSSGKAITVFHANYGSYHGNTRFPTKTDASFYVLQPMNDKLELVAVYTSTAEVSESARKGASSITQIVDTFRQGLTRLSYSANLNADYSTSGVRSANRLKKVSQRKTWMQGGLILFSLLLAVGVYLHLRPGRNM